MEAIIFDVDGTLCDVRSVRHYVTGDQRDFTAFHKASLFCPPNHAVRDLARMSDQAVVVVTARDARFERVTRDWLAKHDIAFEALYMRPWGDQRKDAVVKAEILTAILADGFVPVLAVDDRDDIIEVWNAAGIPTLKVGE